MSNNIEIIDLNFGFSGVLVVKNLPAKAGDTDQILGLGRSPEGGSYNHSSVFAWRTHRQRSLVGYSPWNHEELDMTKHTNTQSIFIIKCQTLYEVPKRPAIQEIQEMCVQSLGQEDPLEEGMATHSSIFGWRIPWTEDSGRLQSMESQKVGHY